MINRLDGIGGISFIHKFHIDWFIIIEMKIAARPPFKGGSYGALRFLIIILAINRMLLRSIVFLDGYKTTHAIDHFQEALKGLTIFNNLHAINRMFLRSIEDYVPFFQNIHL
jgi:hypothetical protein